MCVSVVSLSSACNFSSSSFLHVSKCYWRACDQVLFYCRFLISCLLFITFTFMLQAVILSVNSILNRFNSDASPQVRLSIMVKNDPKYLQPVWTRILEVISKLKPGKNKRYKMCVWACVRERGTVIVGGLSLLQISGWKTVDVGGRAVICCGNLLPMCWGIISRLIGSDWGWIYATARCWSDVFSYLFIRVELT